MIQAARKENSVFGNFIGIRVVQGKVQATAFRSFCRTLHNQFCHVEQIAQLNQIVTDPIVCVVLVNFLLKQVNTMLRALQSLVCSHNPNVIPHETTQFVPVVRNHH